MNQITRPAWVQWKWILVLVLSIALLLAACKDLSIAPAATVRATRAARTPGDLQSSPEPASVGPIVSARPTAQPTRTPRPSATETPTATASPTPLACLGEGGRIEEGSLRSSRVPLPLEYRIYLPPCYGEENERRYPVLYMIHGQNYNHDQWDRLGADETADELIASGSIPPLLIVMPRDRSWAQPSEDGFGQAVIETLIPFIDENYRSLTDRKQRAIGGLSRGAGWAVHLGLSHWELFGSIGAHSLPVFWEDTRFIRTWLDAIPPESLPRIYMDTGEKDYLIRSTLWFAEVLNQKAIPHEWHLFPGYHEEAYWAEHLEQYLRWYTQEW